MGQAYPWRACTSYAKEGEVTKRKLNITAVSFRANGPAKDAPYSHVHVEATASVPTGTKPEAVLEDLREFVLEQLADSQARRNAITRRVSLDHAIEKANADLERMKKLRNDIA